MIRHVESQLSCTLANEEALSISERTDLFGYHPEILYLPLGPRLVVHSDHDAEQVRALRDAMRERKSE